jgi:CRISPR-associated endonuclease Cas3-HD
MLLANSKGQGLLDHCRAIANVAEHLALKLGLSPDLVEAAKQGGLLHDIGKATYFFQGYIKGTTSFEEPFHHEVGWALLRAGRYQGAKVLNAVYWHHARPINDKFETRDTAEDIITMLDQAGIDSVLSFCDLLGVSLDKSLPDQDAMVPDLYNKKSYSNSVNAELMGVRACVIAADRYVSSLAGDISALDLKGLSRYFGEVGVAPYTTPRGYDEARFQKQKECVDFCLKAQTSQVNAPAGFGKTLQGVLFSLERGRRTFWVTPRNVIAESLFLNIQRELEALGVKRSVELFLGGERKGCTDSAIEVGFSDIVVTNIDNLLKPMVSNDVADKLYLSLISDVVFDEYHEFVGGSPLFAAFIHMMRLRHRLSDTPHTLLLSATPMMVHELWDTMAKGTTVLPRKGEHYPAAHREPYKVSFVTGTPLETAPGGVTIMNSIRSAQEIKRTHNTDVVAHSKYTKGNRRVLMDFLLSKFGKGGDGVATGVKVASAPILQAALDISFTWMQESVLSPESTLQRLGRLNRWGDIPGEHKFILLGAEDNKEVAVARALYSTPLRGRWVGLLKKEYAGGKTVTLQDMYAMYSQFYSLHGNEVLEWLTGLLKEGTVILAECAPIKTKEYPLDTNRGASGKSLRTPGGSFYYTVKDAKGVWLPPGNEFSWGYRDMKDSLEKNPRKLSDWQKIVKELLQIGYTSFTRMSKDLKRMKKTPDASAARWSKNEDMPYPAKGLVYQGNPAATDISGIGIGLEGDESVED